MCRVIMTDEKFQMEIIRRGRTYKYQFLLKIYVVSLIRVLLNIAIGNKISGKMKMKGKWEAYNMEVSLYQSTLRQEEKHDYVNEQILLTNLKHILTNNCKIEKIINFKYMMCEKSF